MSKLDCENCPVFLAMQEKQENPGALYQYQQEFADITGEEMPYTLEEYHEYLMDIFESMQTSTDVCPGISGTRYHFFQFAIRYMRFTDKLFFTSTPSSTEAKTVCKNPAILERPKKSRKDKPSSIFLEY